MSRRASINRHILLFIRAADPVAAINRHWIEVGIEADFGLGQMDGPAEEWRAKEEARTADAQDPTTYVNHKGEEFCKAVKGIPTPLGEAILASHRRWKHRG